MATDIPYARKLIEATVSILDLPHLKCDAIDKCIADLRTAHRLMTRTPVKGPRKRISAKMTPALAVAIAADIRANPGEAHQIIGDRHGVLGARVAEMIAGQHDRMLPPHLHFRNRERPGEGPRFKLDAA